MTPKHTPAPWEFIVKDDGEVSGAIIVFRMGPRLGARNGWEPQHQIEYEVSAPDESAEQWGEAEANARLIVAAPELLSVLRKIITAYDGPTVDVATAVSSHMQAARMVLAKAEGRQS